MYTLHCTVSSYDLEKCLIDDVFSEYASKHKLKINEIKNEILYHYGDLKTTVKNILKKGVVKGGNALLSRCHGDTMTVHIAGFCSYQHSTAFLTIHKLEQLKVSVYRMYDATPQTCNTDLLELVGMDGVICNLGNHAQYFAFDGWNIQLASREGVLFKSELFLRPCPLLIGQSYYRYCYVW